MTGRLDPGFLNRARGCAVGAAVGDALGMSLEFGPARPPGDWVREMRPGPYPAGSFTDDTEMALALAESLEARRPLDPDDLAQRFAAWLRAGPIDVGVHTRHVLGRVAAGTPWREAVAAVQAANPDSAGNGSLMRCWPVALVYWDSPGDLLAASAAQSDVTHPHPDCAGACAFASALLYHLLRGVPPDSALRRASSAVRLADEFQALIDAAPAQPRDRLKNSGWVRHTLQSAVWGLLTTASFEEAVVQVANLGQDADTAAAVTGALAGATYGLDAIPARWQAALRGAWPVHSGRLWSAGDFIRLADRLVSLEGVTP